MSSASSALRPELVEHSRKLRGVPICDEYDRMISGMLYNPLQPELMEARHRCRILTQEYNELQNKDYSFSEVAEKRFALLKKLLGHVGADSFIEAPFRPDYGCNISIGAGSFVNFNFTVLDTSLVVIGERVQIAPNVSIFGASHETSVLSRIKFVEFGHPVYIEDDCWIGGNTIILPGVRIGRGCTIGAGSVVTKDIPAYSVAVGSPARVRKQIQSLEEEEADPNNPYRSMVSRT